MNFNPKRLLEPALILQPAFEQDFRLLQTQIAEIADKVKPTSERAARTHTEGLEKICAETASEALNLIAAAVTILFRMHPAMVWNNRTDVAEWSELMHQIESIAIMFVLTEKQDRSNKGNTLDAGWMRVKKLAQFQQAFDKAVAALRS